jgi:ubiquitin-protein ligase
VYPNGVVCISILHEAKEDKFNELEQMSEKWRPIIGVRIHPYYWPFSLLPLLPP